MSPRRSSQRLKRKRAASGGDDGERLQDTQSRRGQRQPGGAPAGGPALLQAQPQEIIAKIAGFLNREEMNNFEMTCVRVHQVIDNPDLVVKPWPSRCPFPIPDGNGAPGHSGPLIWFSNDGSRFVVAVEGWLGSYQVWDRSRGLLGEVEAPLEDQYFEPAFSPDSRLLLLGPDAPDDGRANFCRLFTLPQAGCRLERRLTASRRHRLGTVREILFRDNSTILFLNDDDHSAIRTSKIVTDGRNRVGLSRPEVFVRNSMDGLYFGMSANLCAGDSDSGKNVILSVLQHAVDDSTQTDLVFFDRTRNISVRKSHWQLSNTRYWCSAVSHDGHRLVVTHGSTIALFDLDVVKVEDIGEPTIIDIDFSSNHAGGSVQFVRSSFSPFNSNHLLATLWDVPSDPDVLSDSRFVILDIETKSVLLDGVDDSFWKILLGN